ncbi:MAG TPA: uracil-DNA glycosylase [Sphingomicrobium sp.]|nr:uracil-DNA glycosylase [Sphingomicrobium sp.]
MAETVSAMGGTGIAMDKREAASALRWWLESGVDTAIQEQPRNWFDRAPAPAPPEPAAPQAAPPPDTLEAFQQWLSSSADAPLASAGARPVLPRGSEGAEIMLLFEPPSSEELAGGQPVGGEAGQLMERMLAAIGLTGQAYAANLACFHSTGARLSAAQMERCASAAKRHVALAKPKRLLLLGDAPSRIVLGKPLVEARGHVHSIEGIRTIVTFHPRQLLKRPSDKARAWKDLLLLMEEAP